MLKLLLTGYFCLLIFNSSLAQSKDGSKWSVSFGMMPNIAIAPIDGSLDNVNIFTSTYEDLRDLKPALNLYANYKLNNLVSLRAGIGFTYCDKYIGREYPENYSLYEATMSYVEVPLIADFYIVKKEENKLFLSLGNVSSFNIAQTNISGEWWDLMWPLPIQGPIPTLVYQNYLQIGIGYERKLTAQSSIYINPLYRFALINYFTKGYQYRTPSAAYLTLSGVEIGIKYRLTGK